MWDLTADPYMDTDPSIVLLPCIHSQQAVLLLRVCRMPAWLCCRKLSLVYHPDKNPDPKATEYFAEYITKAYQALTDETARANYEKFGHPDGQQATDVGIALPEWIFSKDRKTAPLVLGGEVLRPGAPS